MTILVAEDESLMLKTIELKLKKEGYDVVGCDNGGEAIEKLNALVPDMVITDIMLPFASGFEIIKVLKASPVQKNIPILVLSGTDEQDSIEEAFSLGADDYITKPFSLAELSVRVKRLIGVLK
jgi:DNA-binding response OmpR family regulator